jgi:hypothetical protein
MEPRGLCFHNISTRVFLLNQIYPVYALSSYFYKILITTILFHDLSFLFVSDNNSVHPSLFLHACYMPHISYHHSFEKRKKIFLWVTSPRCFLFCTMTNKYTVSLQIITLLHVSTLSCHPHGACNQYIAKLHEYFKCSWW